MDFGLAHDAPVKLYEANKGRAPIVKDHRLHAAQKENVGLHLRILPLCVCVVCDVLLCVPVVWCVCYVVVCCACLWWCVWCFVVCSCVVCVM